MRRNLDMESKGEYTLKQVAADFDISYGVLRNKANKEQWRESMLRQLQAQEENIRGHLIEQSKKAISALQQDVANVETTVRQKHANLARMMQKKAYERIKDINPKTLSIQNAIILMKLGINEERRALGMPDEFELKTTDEAAKHNFGPKQANTIIDHVINLMKNAQGDYVPDEQAS